MDSNREHDQVKGLRVCWVDTARYTQPLSASLDKKWKALTDLGVDILVCGFAADLRPRRFQQHAHFYLLPQSPVRVLRYLTIYLCAPWLVLWLILTRNVHILIAHDPHVAFAAALSKIFARPFGKKVALVIESRGDFEGALFTQRQITFKRLYRLMMDATARFAFRHGDVLRAISASTREQLLRWSPGKPLVQFMSWTDSDSFVTAQRTAPPSQSDTILYAGVLVPGKGVHRLIEAFAALVADHPNLRLQLVGKPENPAYAAQLHQQVQQAALQAHVQFIPPVTQAELAAYMAAARVLVLPSFSEGLGKVLVEAMLCGTPVIGTKVGGIPDVVEDGVNGYLVPPDDSAALLDSLRKLMDDARVDALSQPAQDFARSYFSPETYVANYARVFALAQQSRVARMHA